MSLSKTFAAVAVAAGAIAASASASAEPGHFSFYDCTGPAGMPSSFTAIKQNLPDNAAHPASAAVAFRRGWSSCWHRRSPR